MRLLTKRKVLWFYGVIFALIVTTTQVLAQPDTAAQTPDATQSHGRINSVQFSPDGRYWAMSETKVEFNQEQLVLDHEGSRVRLWEVATGRLVWSKRSAANDISALLFSPDSSRLLCYGTRLILKNNRTAGASTHRDVWEVATGQTAFELEVAADERHGGLVYTSDGKSLIGNTGVSVIDADGKKTLITAVKEWNAATGKLVRTINAEWKAATSGDWALAGNLIASRGLSRQNDTMESTLFVWTLPELSPVNSLTLGEGNTSRFAFSPDGKRVAFNFYNEDNLGLTNEVLNLWNIAEKSFIPITLPPDTNVGVQNFRFSPDGKTLIGSGIAYEQVPFQKTQLWFWDAQTGELKQTRTVAESSLEVGELSPQAHLLPDGKSYLLFGQGKKPELRNLEDLSLVRVFE